MKYVWIICLKWQRCVHFAHPSFLKARAVEVSVFPFRFSEDAIKESRLLAACDWGSEVKKMKVTQIVPKTGWKKSARAKHCWKKNHTFHRDDGLREWFLFTSCTAKLLRPACQARLRPLSIPTLFDTGTACTNMAGCASSWTTVRVEISPKSSSLPRGEMLQVVQLPCGRDGLSKLHDPNIPTYRDRNSSKQKEASKEQEGLPTDPTASRFPRITFA